MEESTELLATETETSVIDMVTEPASPMPCHDVEIHPKAIMEPSWNDTSVFLGNDEQTFPELLRTHETQQKNA